MSEIKSLAFRIDYLTKVRELKTNVTVFAVSAPPPNKSAVVSAIWDTGATHSVITPSLAEYLKLFPIDSANIIGVTNEKPESVPVSIIHIALPNNVLISARRVCITNIGGGADMLIGMDIISIGDFLISNFGNKTSFSFVIPPFPDQPDWVKRSVLINKGIQTMDASSTIT